MKKQIEQIIIEAVKELNEEMGSENFHNITGDTLLYGADGNVDSIALVSLITDIESKISDLLGKNISLADERAMSQRNSPFKSIQSLTEFIDTLLKDEV